MRAVAFEGREEDHEVLEDELDEADPDGNSNRYGYFQIVPEDVLVAESIDRRRGTRCQHIHMVCNAPRPNDLRVGLTLDRTRIVGRGVHAGTRRRHQDV